MFDQLKTRVTAFLRHAAAILRELLNSLTEHCEGTLDAGVSLVAHPFTPYAADVARARKWPVRRVFQRLISDCGDDGDAELLIA